MLRYARKLGVIVTYFNEKAIVRIGDKRFDDSCSLQKVLFRLTIDRDLEKVKQLSIQGPYLCLSGIQLKSSHSVLYNWSIQDSLVKFVIKAHLSYCQQTLRCIFGIMRIVLCIYFVEVILRA